LREYILKEVTRLKTKYKTDDPFLIAEALNIDVREDPSFSSLKGFYCIMNRQRFIVINANLSPQEKRVVCAHELGHDRLHRKMASAAPLKDFALYEMTSKPEYQANIFAAEMLISDDDILTLARSDMDYFTMCRSLSYAPELVSFKLFSMVQRGHPINVPQNVNSRFLK